jgi:hypothetical protein
VRAGVALTHGHVRLEEVLQLGVATALIGVAFWFTHAPLFDPPNTIDPWLYTSLFVNFHQIYHAFVGTYYPSRLPWVIPGLLANQVFEPVNAYYALHLIFVVAGLGGTYFTVRHFFGRRAAIASFIWVAGSQMFFNANRWDYWDGALIGYMAVAMYLTVVPGRWHHARLAGAGFALAAAVTTNLYVLALAAPLPLLYAAARWRGDLQTLIRRARSDCVAFAVGIGSLLVACGAFAKANGGPFWFVGPQIRAAQTIKGTVYKQPYSFWVHQEPRILVPVILAVLVTFAAVRSRDLDRRARVFALGAAGYLGLVSLILAVDEVFLGGYFIEYGYYFSPLMPAMALCLGAFFKLAVTEKDQEPLGAVALALVFTAVIVPLVYIYRPDRVDRVGEGVYAWTGVAFAVGTACYVARARLYRLPGRLAAGLTSIALVSLASAWALDGSSMTFTSGQSATEGRQTFDVGMQLVSYLDETTGDGPLPAFWYDSRRAGGSIVAIQSLYYYAYTYLGIRMPTIDAEFRRRQSLLKPAVVVLLCTTRSCDGAPAVLRRAPPRLQLRSERRLVSGTLAVWVAVFRRGAP